MLEGRTYVPLIYTRPAEMRALEELPSVTKNLIVPIIRLRPWLTARELSRSIERIKEAIGERSFGLDLDASRRNHREGSAYADFEQLFDPNAAWQNYYAYVEVISAAIPVLRSAADMQLPAQLAHAKRIERGLIVRVNVQQPFSVDAVARECLQQKLENVVFVLDCGWREHLLPLQAACVGLIRTIADISNEFEIVAAGGDFPASGFDRHGTHFEIPGEERQFVDNVRRVLNDVDIVFGDWASGREPVTDDQIRRSRPRIDMPTRRGWECWRSATPAGTFADLAVEAARDRQLRDKSDYWGEQMIIATKSGDEPSIKTLTTAAAVRMNLHMMLQAHFDTGGEPSIEDELVVGEI